MPWMLTALIGWAVSAELPAADWPQWRGPDFNGSSPETGLPAVWSKTEGLAWSVPMPGPGAATPIVWGDHVLVSSTDLASQGILAMCLDRRTGQVRWQQRIAEGIRRDNRSTFASSSPVTDGQRAFFFSSTGDLAAFDMEGRKLWGRNIQADYGPFAFLWTFSSTPALFDGRLYVQVCQRDVPVSGRGRTDGPNESYLMALDPGTGKTLWRQIRPSDAVAESREAFTTPIPSVHGGAPEILVAGGDCLTGHDPATGQERWRWGTWNPSRISHWRLVPSPVAGAGLVLACAPKGSPVYAIKAGGRGRLDDAAVAWKSDQQRAVSSDVPTPLFYQGDFFVLSDVRKALSRIDPATGRVKWSIETPGRAKYEASPTGADRRIFLMSFDGTVVVVDADRGAVLHVIPMGDPGDDMIRSTISVARGQLFIRTNQRLFCVGKSPLPGP
ncbi:MAG TPA: PQQ-binding-like beta-propeller repeat protein [Candidatus Paceibacterota bacterium]|nr:PQQ-binding-like beta-propeller repeat protein [Verrucomicrobiota bacterium]HOX04464.1 PQQ-binding-like beta-propeller repeat protein [Verrucomicrobiota bacterium]HRZ93186.1 PQQ-binding-like beta-propeller repeat protein [Candidatus Paceibacterota bacterium]